MVHYKIGIYLKAQEIVLNDPMFGMTQKAFGVGFYQAKKIIYRELMSLSMQIERYLGLTQ